MVLVVVSFGACRSLLTTSNFLSDSASRGSDSGSCARAPYCVVSGLDVEVEDGTYLR